MRAPKTKGVLVAATLAALVAGGGTLALWQSEATVDGATIQTGKLSISPRGMSVADVSKDIGAPVPISPEDKMVPGDTFRFARTVKVDLEGKNLKAELRVNKTEWFSGTVMVDDFKIGKALICRGELDATQTDGCDVFDPTQDTFTPNDNGAVFTIAYEVNFLKKATGSIDATGVINNIPVTLNQVRPAP